MIELVAKAQDWRVKGYWFELHNCAAKQGT